MKTPPETQVEAPAYWSGLARSLSPYVPGEQPQGEKIIKLNTNENPYPPSPKVIEAIAKAADEKLKLYPDPSCAALRKTIASRWNIKPEQVFCGNGSDEVLAFAFAAFFDSAEPVLFPNITYSFYPVYAALWNIPCKTLPLNKDFSIDAGGYEQNACNAALANPNAPTGRALTVNDLSKIASALEKNKKTFIVDEAYIAFSDEKGTGSMIPFINEHRNLLVVRTLSKEASLAGLRSGFAAGSEELMQGLCRVRDSFNSYTLDRLAQAASAAAVSDTVYYEEINGRIRRTRKRASEALAALNFDVVPSQANFVFASPPPESMKAPAWLAALRERGVLVRHFKQKEIENHLRVSIGTDEDMDAFINACEDILRSGQ